MICGIYANYGLLFWYNPLSSAILVHISAICIAPFYPVQQYLYITEYQNNTIKNNLK